jgi:hypothetical protein
MRGKGVCYDTGFFNRGVSTHEPFDPEVVERELRIIREDLHCTAVRLTGGDLERLKIAAVTPPRPGWRSGSPPSPPTSPATSCSTSSPPSPTTPRGYGGRGPRSCC